MTSEADWSNRIDTALADVKRDAFIQSHQEGLVAGRSIPPENTVRQILTVCDIWSGAKVLHIGAGSGYLTAVLAVLSQNVVAIEKVPTLASFAKDKLQELGLKQVIVREGDGSKGAPEHGPYDLILISTPKIAVQPVLLEQLAPKGQLICIEPGEASRQILVKYVNRGNHKAARTEHGFVDFVQNQDDILVELGFVTPEVLNAARREAEANKTLIIDEIMKLQNLDDLKVYRSLAKQYGMPLTNADTLLRNADPSIFARFSKAYLDHQHTIPLYVDGKNLIVACTSPNSRMEEIQQVFPDKTIERQLVTPTDFRRLWSSIDRQLRGKDSPVASRKDINSPGYDEDLLEKEASAIDARLVSLYEALLLDAVADRASDIHLELYRERVRVRLRVDGELLDLRHYQISPAEYRGLINVIKLRADLNIAERRLPQGGRAQVRVGGSRFDLRIQVQPSLHGEHVVIRLLAQNSALISIDKLGMPEQIANHYRRLLHNPAGLVLVVGPTGSGKTTTLNAGLQLLAEDSSRKVITVEDPIEYSIDDIQQTRVRPDIGFNFADAMRSFVRQDPDVILVGEIRDHETALEALRASQTGHVVLSTLHCNDAVDAVQRLFDLNVHPNSLASELLAVIAQRLAKRICPHCKQPETEPDPQILAEVFPSGMPNGFVSFVGAGCDQCGGSGTRGRLGVIEYLQLNGELRDAISRHMPLGELRALALDSGLVTMRDSALDHVINGAIPLTELPRILPQERMAPEKRGQWQPA